MTGEVKRGRVVPADREHLRRRLARFVGQDNVRFALEGRTGWRYVTEELSAAGIIAHLAGPADTAAPRRRAGAWRWRLPSHDVRHYRGHITLR